MKRLILAFTLLASPAFAQQAPWMPDDYNVAMQALAQQREAASNQIVDLSVKLAQTQRELAKAKADLGAKAPSGQE